MKNLKLVFSLMLLVSTMWSCSKVNTLDLERQAVEDLYNNRDKEKWEKEDLLKKQNYEDSIRIAEENKAKYALYLQDLREYKSTKHPVMFGWFNAWSAVTPGDYANLTLIPDSMDIVSIWGNCFNIDEKRLKQMRTVQEKGTKVTVGWIIENVGNGISNRAKNEWSSDPETGVKEYAQAILDSVAKTVTMVLISIMSLLILLRLSRVTTVAIGPKVGLRNGRNITQIMTPTKIRQSGLNTGEANGLLINLLFHVVSMTTRTWKTCSSKLCVRDLIRWKLKTESIAY